MGKATIVSGGTGGQYTVQLNYNTARIDSRIAEIDLRLADINLTEYANLQSAYTTAQTTLDNAIAALDTVVSDYVSGSATRDEVKQAQAVVLEKQALRDTAKVQFDNIKVRKLSLEKERQFLIDNTPNDDIVSAWCADFNENLSGEVGTIEIPGQRQAGIPVIIKPSFSTNDAAFEASDGQLQPAIASTPFATYYNWAMLPGWQKWMPTYRLATLTNIDFSADTGTVTLDNAYSTEQTLDVNYQTTYDNVPIVYMDCNAAAFTNNDRVVVQFVGQDKTSPKVVGFENNPVDCLFELYAFGARPTYSKWALKYIRSLQYDSTNNYGPSDTNYLYAGTDYWNGDYYSMDITPANGYFNVIKKNGATWTTVSTAQSISDVAVNSSGIYCADFQPLSPNGYNHIHKLNTSGTVTATNNNTMPDYGDCFVECNETRVIVGVHNSGQLYCYDENLNHLWNINVYTPYRIQGMAINDDKVYLHVAHEDMTLPVGEQAVYSVLIYDIDGNYIQTVSDMHREYAMSYLGISASENYIFIVSSFAQLEKWAKVTNVDPNTGAITYTYTLASRQYLQDAGSNAEYPYLTLWPRGPFA